MLIRMTFFARMSPLRAVRDLRVFLSQREPHELWFLVAAIVVTTLLIAGFVHDSKVEKVYRPDIMYVQQWRLDRTEEQILAQQKIDQVKKNAEMAAQKKREQDLQAQFKKLDDRMTKWGL